MLAYDSSSAALCASYFSDFTSASRLLSLLIFTLAATLNFHSIFPDVFRLLDLPLISYQSNSRRDALLAPISLAAKINNIIDFLTYYGADDFGASARRPPYNS